MPEEGRPITGSPGSHRRAVDDRVEGDGAEAGAGDVEAADQVAELGELAAGDLDPGQLGAARQADADLLADLRVGALDRDVVEHRQRLGADADHVVDVHRHAVDPDRVEAAELLGDQQLGADAVGGERDPGPLVDPDHARVVAGQRHLPRGPAELDRAQRPHQPGDRGVRRALVDPGLGVGVAHRSLQLCKNRGGEGGPVGGVGPERAVALDQADQALGGEGRGEGGGDADRQRAAQLGRGAAPARAGRPSARWRRR